MSKFQRLSRVGISAVVVTTLAACANQPYGNSNYPSGSQPVYTQPGYSQPGYSSFGTIANVEMVRAGGGTGGIAGAAIGGVAGGVLGNQVGGGSGRTVATVAGVIGGALIGQAVERNSAAGRGADVYRVTVRLDNGSSQVFDYQQSPNVRIGERVRVEGNQLYR
ncbi:glycine zipper 2TM domain-containing protein [Ottowia thiooxydans]|uniref:glycine zipper 2TM domain-containing protein n=1 Tax=Ottowia thiooxydans TaxID=219182 RepID=UPI0003FA6A5E|nr:glycine zipper 2TM domain-containing protein [Ottowia thiooxydans]